MPSALVVVSVPVAVEEEVVEQVVTFVGCLLGRQELASEVA